MSVKAETELHDFNDLMQVALRDGPAQRLLMVMIQVQRVLHRHGHGNAVGADNEGTLTPLMVRDRPLEAGLTFADIVADADAVRQDWEFVMMAVLPGRDGQPPTSADAEPCLRRMAKTIVTGEDASGFAFFDRDGQPIVLGTPHA